MNKKMKIYSLSIEIIQLFFFPILKWQGKIVKDTVLKLPEAKGSRSGEKGSGKRLNILITGDSSACGVGVAHITKSLAGHLIKILSQVYQCNWKIIAKSGLNTSNLIKIIEEQESCPFDIVIISVGMNDITSGISRENWMREMKKLQTSLQIKFNPKQFIFCGLPPVGKFKIIPNPLKWILALKAKLFDLSLNKFCNNNPKSIHLLIKLPFEEKMIAIDGFHPSEEFYKLWACIINDKIKKII